MSKTKKGLNSNELQEYITRVDDAMSLIYNATPVQVDLMFDHWRKQWKEYIIHVEVETINLQHDLESRRK